MHKSWILWIQILHLNQFMYQTNIAYETTKFSQQSVGSIPSLANLMDGRMSVLVLNAGPNISVCCVVFVPVPCAYQLHSHYNYLHSSLLLLLVLFPYQLPSPVCCPTLSAQLSTCVSLRGTHTFSHALSYASPHMRPTLYKKDMCCDGHVTVHVAVLTAVTQSDDGPPEPSGPVIICIA